MSAEELPPTEKPARRPGWKRFQKLSVDPKRLRRSARKAETATVRHARELVFRRLDNIRYIRRHIIIWFVAVAVILLGIVAQFLLSSRSFTHTAATSGGTYAEGVVGRIESLNPLQASTSSEVAASRLMFSTLYKYDVTGHLAPDVAQHTTISASGEVYTVKLREDVKWHDGQALTADDVVFTINTIKNPESRSRPSLQANWKDISAERLGEYTVKFTLPPYAAFAHALTFPIVPEHLLSNVPAAAIPESAFASSPVGSGPFVFRFLQNTDLTTAHRTVYMAANTSYHKSIPRISRFELSAYPDEASLSDALKRREVTAGADVRDSAAEALADSSFDLKHYALNNGVYLLINTNHEILSDKNVRRALQAGVDTSKVRSVAGTDMPELWLPILPSHLPDRNDAPAAPKYDIDRARKILTDAGWKLDGGKRSKDGKTLQLELTTIKGEQFERVIDEIAKQLQDLGITATKRVIDDRQPNSNFRQGVLQQRNYDLLIYELPIGADPDVYAYWHSSQLGTSGYNFTNYSNGVSDAALVSARDRVDPELRATKYVTFSEQWLSDAPAIGLYQQVFTYAVNRNATALKDGAELVMAVDRYSNVEQWAVNRGVVYKTP